MHHSNPGLKGCVRWTSAFAALLIVCCGFVSFFVLCSYAVALLYVVCLLMPDLAWLVTASIADVHLNSNLVSLVVIRVCPP